MNKSIDLISELSQSQNVAKKLEEDNLQKILTFENIDRDQDDIGKFMFKTAMDEKNQHNLNNFS